MAKKITLRKSAAIQKELFARANNLHIETGVEINEFVRPNEIIETGLREVLDNLTHKQDLLTTLYALRAKTGVVNAKSGISAMLAEQERLKHTMTIYRNFVSDRHVRNCLRYRNEQKNCKNKLKIGLVEIRLL